MVHIKKEKKASSNLIIKQKLCTECHPAFLLVLYHSFCTSVAKLSTTNLALSLLKPKTIFIKPKFPFLVFCFIFFNNLKFGLEL